MRVLQGILLSLFLHFFLVWVSQFAPLLAKPKDNAITVDIIDPSHNETKQKELVRQALVPDSVKVDHSDDPLSFLSEKTQRVRKQTQALLNGMTQNREQAAAKAKAAKKMDLSPHLKPRQTPQPKTASFKNGDLNLNPSRDIAQAQAEQDLNLPQGMSTVGEALPKEVEVGSFTALNTDRYLYYSFFSRVEELIRFRWETGVREVIDSTPPARFRQHYGNSWITEVDIWLKPDGEFHSAHIMREAGMRGFDMAVVQAFMQARLFPHPPQEMVESDGFIHLKYSFEVRYEPKVLSDRE
jgi:outer membrane biosynthesis protein TonB